MSRAIPENFACRCPECQCTCATPHHSGVCFNCRPGSWPGRYNPETKEIEPQLAKVVHARQPRTAYPKDVRDYWAKKKAARAQARMTDDPEPESEEPEGIFA